MSNPAKKVFAKAPPPPPLASSSSHTANSNSSNNSANAPSSSNDCCSGGGGATVAPLVTPVVPSPPPPPPITHPSVGSSPARMSPLPAPPPRHAPPAPPLPCFRHAPAPASGHPSPPTSSPTLTAGGAYPAAAGTSPLSPPPLELPHVSPAASSQLLRWGGGGGSSSKGTPQTAALSHSPFPIDGSDSAMLDSPTAPKPKRVPLSEGPQDDSLRPLSPPFSRSSPVLSPTLSQPSFAGGMVAFPVATHVTGSILALKTSLRQRPTDSGNVSESSHPNTSVSITPRRSVVSFVVPADGVEGEEDGEGHSGGGGVGGVGKGPSRLAALGHGEPLPNWDQMAASGPGGGGGATGGSLVVRPTKKANPAAVVSAVDGGGVQAGDKADSGRLGVTPPSFRDRIQEGRAAKRKPTAIRRRAKSGDPAGGGFPRRRNNVGANAKGRGSIGSNRSSRTASLRSSMNSLLISPANRFASLAFVAYFRVRVFAVIKRRREAAHFLSVTGPRAAFVIQCCWRRYQQRQRVTRHAAASFLQLWIRFKMSRLRRVKDNSVRLLQRVFRGEQTRSLMGFLYEQMNRNRARGVVRRFIMRWEAQIMLRRFKYLRDERNVFLEECHRAMIRILRSERADLLEITREAGLVLHIRPFIPQADYVQEVTMLTGVPPLLVRAASEEYTDEPLPVGRRKPSGGPPFPGELSRSSLGNNMGQVLTPFAAENSLPMQLPKSRHFYDDLLHTPLTPNSRNDSAADSLGKQPSYSAQYLGRPSTTSDNNRHHPSSAGSAGAGAGTGVAGLDSIGGNNTVKGNMGSQNHDVSSCGNGGQNGTTHDAHNWSPLRISASAAAPSAMATTVQAQQFLRDLFRPESADYLDAIPARRSPVDASAGTPSGGADTAENGNNNNTDSPSAGHPLAPSTTTATTATTASENALALLPLVIEAVTGAHQEGDIASGVSGQGQGSYAVPRPPALAKGPSATPLPLVLPPVPAEQQQQRPAHGIAKRVCALLLLPGVEMSAQYPPPPRSMETSPDSSGNSGGDSNSNGNDTTELQQQQRTSSPTVADDGANDEQTSKAPSPLPHHSAGDASPHARGSGHTPTSSHEAEASVGSDNLSRRRKEHQKQNDSATTTTSISSTSTSTSSHLMSLMTDDGTGYEVWLEEQKRMSSDGVLSAYVDLLCLTESIERKTLEQELLSQHASFLEPVRLVSYAIHLSQKHEVPPFYAPLLLAFQDFLSMRLAAKFFVDEQKQRMGLLAEYDALPLEHLGRPILSSAAEARHRALVSFVAAARDPVPRAEEEEAAYFARVMQAITATGTEGQPPLQMGASRSNNDQKHPRQPQQKRPCKTGGRGEEVTVFSSAPSPSLPLRAVGGTAADGDKNDDACARSMPARLLPIGGGPHTPPPPPRRKLAVRMTPISLDPLTDEEEEEDGKDVPPGAAATAEPTPCGVTCPGLVPSPPPSRITFATPRRRRRGPPIPLLRALDPHIAAASRQHQPSQSPLPSLPAPNERQPVTASPLDDAAPLPSRLRVYGRPPPRQAAGGSASTGFTSTPWLEAVCQSISFRSGTSRGSMGVPLGLSTSAMSLRQSESTSLQRAHTHYSVDHNMVSLVPLPSSLLHMPTPAAPSVPEATTSILKCHTSDNDSSTSPFAGHSVATTANTPQEASLPAPPPSTKRYPRATQGRDGASGGSSRGGAACAAGEASAAPPPTLLSQRMASASDDASGGLSTPLVGVRTEQTSSTGVPRAACGGRTVAKERRPTTRGSTFTVSSSDTDDDEGMEVDESYRIAERVHKSVCGPGPREQTQQPLATPPSPPPRRRAHDLEVEGSSTATPASISQ